MVSTDPIADMLSRIRNASAVNKAVVQMPHSGVKEDIARLLARHGFLNKVDVKEDNGRKQLEIVINDEQQPSVITEIKRKSRPGRREYIQAKDIPTIKRGRGMVIVSTSQGIMSGTDAKTKKLGGELICEVY